MGAQPPSPLDPGFAREARGALDDAGYTLDGIVAALGVEDVRALDRVPWDTVMLRLGEGPLDAIIKLFMLGAEVDSRAAATALGPLDTERWVDAGLIEAGPDSTRALVRVVPDDELMLASDWPGSAERAIPSDHVLGHNPTAALLDNITVRRPVGSALDIGTGCGVQALIAARHAEQVVATDLNPRALDFARFNALLNDVELKCLEGSLFEPVGDRTFDLIVANPPFVISPVQDFLFRDSDLGGEGIVRRIIAEAGAHLNDAGMCQMLCNFAHLEGTDFTERVASAFTGSGCDAWVIALEKVDPAVYASGWVRSVEFDPERYKRVLAEWVEYYEREGITGMTWAIVTMRKAAGDPWFELTEIKGRIDDRCGDHVLRCFEGHALLKSTGDEDLLDRSPRVADGARLRQSFAPEADGWSAVDGELATEPGLPIHGGVDPHVANLLVRCDGELTLRENLERSAQDAGVPFEKLRPEGLRIVRRLYEGGYLED